MEPDLTGKAKRSALWDRCKELDIEFPGRGMPKNKDMEAAIVEAENKIQKEVKAEIKALDQETEAPIPLEEVEADLAVQEEDKNEHPLLTLPMDIRVNIFGQENHRAVIETEGRHNFGFVDGWTVIGEEWQRRALLDWAEHKFGPNWEDWLMAEPARYE